MIGASWAAEYLAGSFEVVATDPAPNAEANLRKYIDNAWKDLTTIGLSTGASREGSTFTTELKAALSNADLRSGKRTRASDFKIKLFAALRDATPRRLAQCVEFFGDNTKVIYGHPAVREVAVFGIPEPKWGEIVKAWVVLKPGKTLSADELIEFCRQSLAKYKISRRIDFPKPNCPRVAQAKY